MAIDIAYDDFISYVSSLIDDIYSIIQQKDKLGHDELVKRLIDVVFNPKNRIMLGVLIIAMSFLLYILDVTTE